MRKKKYIQTLIFSKDCFKCKSEIKRWMKRKKYSMIKKNIYSSKKEYRVMQKKMNKFNRKSLKICVLQKGVKAMKGHLK